MCFAAPLLEGKLPMPIQPVFGAQSNEDLTVQQYLAFEEAIVWTEDVSDMDYVRQSMEFFASTRRRPVAWRGVGRRVGYSVLRGDAPSDDGWPGRFVRRIFWLKPNDRSEQPHGVYERMAPSEAVDPRTINPGVWGDLTDRAWGEPRPGACRYGPQAQEGAGLIGSALPAQGLPHDARALDEQWPDAGSEDDIGFARTVACPRCRAAAGQPCRSRLPEKVRRSHMARQDLAIWQKQEAYRHT